MLRVKTLDDESGDLSVRISSFIQQNSHVFQSSRNQDKQEMPRQPNFLSNAQIPFSEIDVSVKMAIKKITPKLFSQLKFMIKPCPKVVYICSSFLALIAGQPPLNNQRQLLTLEDVNWNQLQLYFSQTTLILQSFNKFQEYVRQKKIVLLNYESANHYLNLAQQSYEPQMNPQQESLINSLLSIIPSLMDYIMSCQPSFDKKSKKNSQSMSCYSLSKPQQECLIQQQDPEQSHEQQFLPTKDNPTKTVVKSLAAKQRQVSMNSQTSLSPNGSVNSSRRSDLQERVQVAQQMKISRLEKILGLRVKKPVVGSQVRLNQKWTPNKSDKKTILLEEIAKNQDEIKMLRREELNFKWEVDREVKQLSRIEEKERQSDDITRYRKFYDQKHQFKNVLTAWNQSPVKKGKQSRMKKCNVTKENKSMVIQECIFQKVQECDSILQQNEQIVKDLKNELINCQQTKEEMLAKLRKTIYNCCSKQYLEENNDYAEK